MTSKRFQEATTAIDKSKVYTAADAIALVKKSATAKFDETIEIHMNLGIDPKQGDQQIRATVVLPHGTGKTKKVAAFVDAANENAAKSAGADIVGGEEMIEEIARTGKIDFDVAVAVPSMMPKLAKAAKVLGPRGLMPNPKTDTVGPNIAKIIEEQKGGKVAFKNDNTGNLHLVIGKASFDAEKLAANLVAAVDAVKKTKPAASKGIFVKSATITSTMGPAVKFDTNAI